ncbi:penicillin-binding protein 2 [Arcobacter sp. CECT 8989]|uniref:penicillin-binding protein 2 n=1 Tax=Arcobacter sp. CECT 8989 TaxID=2044509 RepID=UPI00100A9770|nr:penicillin-binding protein 2 [Arcobacter sp. CECT 8989]RXK01969.1 penicillin-binding protein 2 [Arcobacter sp. CECT 8989]
MNRLNFIFIFIIFICIILLSRVYSLSIKSNNYYEELSKENYIKKIYLTPNRGIIKDRNGEILAMNKLGFSINIEPHLSLSNKKKTLNSIIQLVNKYYPKLEKDTLYNKYIKYDSNYNHDFVKIVEFIPYEDFIDKYTIFNSNESIQIKSEVKRVYPHGKNAAHIIGYIGKASKEDIKNNRFSKFSKVIGKNGLEKFYNERLQGHLGYKKVKVNALNKEIEILEKKEPFTENNLDITIDINLQKYVQKLFKNKSGAVIVMDAQNGELLVAGSYPEFDNNIFVDGVSTENWNKLKNDFNHPFTNKLIQGKYPPGSIIKMGVALSFLENGLSPKYKVNSIGAIKIGNRSFRDWKKDGHGIVGFERALRVSSDEFFYQGSLEVGINKISKTLSKYGIGKKTGIDLYNEHYGTNPNKEWKLKKHNLPWYVGETVITAIGQGEMLVTPMQMARYTAFLATGELPFPHLAKDAYIKPIEIKTDKKHINIIRKGMRQVVTKKEGTAHKHTKNSKIAIAAKTGTAQVIAIPQTEKERMKESELEYYHRSHAWLTTYGPYNANKKYVVTVLVEHGGHGGSAAGEIVSKIYNKLLEKGYIENK